MLPDFFNKLLDQDITQRGSALFAQSVSHGAAT
jgi:hypothetical protein